MMINGPTNAGLCQPVIIVPGAGVTTGLTVEDVAGGTAGFAGGTTGLAGMTEAGVVDVGVEAGRPAGEEGTTVGDGATEPSVELSCLTVTVQFLQVTEIKWIQLTLPPFIRTLFSLTMNIRIVCIR